MRYQCVYPKCPAQFAAVVGMGKPDIPLFLEKRLAIYEIDEDGFTVDLYEEEETDAPILCAYCRKPAKSEPP